MVDRLLGHLKEHETTQSARAAAPIRISCPDTEKRAAAQQRRSHIATMTLVYLTRCKLGKQKLAEHGGIQILVRMVNGEGFTSESRAQSLQLLWNEVYLDEHKELMVENDIIQVVMKYVKDPKSQPKGIKCAYFLMSHLAHKYPDRVNESGIVQEVLTQISELRTPMTRMSEFCTPINPTNAQTLEGICRLIWSLTLTETTRRSLSTPETVQALLCALNVDRDLDCSVVFPYHAMIYESVTGSYTTSVESHSRICAADTQHLGAPNDAHKMRAAAALDKLAADPNLSEASSALDAQLLKWETIESLAPAGAEDANEAASYCDSTGILMWLGVQPHINQMIRKRPQLMNKLKNKLKSDTFREDFKSYDVIILLLATMESPAQLKELVATDIETQNGTSGMVRKTVPRHMLSMFNQEGHSM